MYRECDDVKLFRPGDLSTIFRPSSSPIDRDESSQTFHSTVEKETSFVEVLIHVFWRCERDFETRNMTWLTINQSDWPVSFICHHRVRSTHGFQFDQSETIPEGVLLIAGIWLGGQIMGFYLMVCHISFTESCFIVMISTSFPLFYPRVSAGGVYLLPLGLPPKLRRTSTSIRAVSLTPPGLSSNKALSRFWTAL